MIVNTIIPNHQRNTTTKVIMKNPSWYEDPPEDEPELTPEEEAENWGDYQYQRLKDEKAERMGWDTPDHAPYNQ